MTGQHSPKQNASSFGKTRPSGRKTHRSGLGHLVKEKDNENQNASKETISEQAMRHTAVRPLQPSGYNRAILALDRQIRKTLSSRCSEYVNGPDKPPLTQLAHLTPCLIFSNSLCSSAVRTLCRTTFPLGPISIMVGKVCTPNSLASRLPSSPPGS